MNKKAFLTAFICLMLIGINKSVGKPPAGGLTSYQAVDATTAQSYIANYKTNVPNKFAEAYILDANAIGAIATSGATAIRMYNALAGEANKVAIMVPVDANFNNNTSVPQMAAMSGTWLCPPNCDVTKTGASATQISNANAQAAITSYNSNGSFDSYNAFIIYPAAIAALKTGGAVSIQICHGINSSTGARCMIYRGVNASGAATYLMEDASNMCNRCGM